MRDEFDARLWNAEHDSVGNALTQFSDDFGTGVGNARQAFSGQARNLGFRGAAMVAALVVSGSSILLTVAPVAGA